MYIAHPFLFFLFLLFVINLVNNKDSSDDTDRKDRPTQIFKDNVNHYVDRGCFSAVTGILVFVAIVAVVRFEDAIGIKSGGVIFFSIIALAFIFVAGCGYYSSRNKPSK